MAPFVDPFRPPSMVTISVSELDSLLGLLPNTAGSGNLGDAASKFQQIKNAVLELNRICEDLKRGQRAQADYDEVKRSYEAQIVNLRREMDEAVRNARESERATIERLRSEIQRITAANDRSLRAFEEERAAHRETLLSFCISEINHASYDSAVEKFKALGDEMFLPRIVKAVYADNLENFEKVLKFVRKLPYIKHDIIGYDALLEEMRRNNHLQSSLVLLIAFKVKETMDMTIYSNALQDTKTKMTGLQNKLTPVVKNVIQLWAAKIRIGSYEEVTTFAREYSDEFKLQLGPLIKLAYADNEAHIEMLVKFSRALPFIEQCVVAYVALFEEMRRNNHLQSHLVLLLAFGVKETMEMTNYNNIAQEMKTKITSLQNKLTPLVENVIQLWAGKVRAGTYDKLVHVSQITHSGLDDHLAKLIKLAYADNDANIQMLIKFSIALHTIKQSAIAYDALYEEMRRNNHLETTLVLLLAYRVKEIMEMPNYNTIAQELQTKMTELNKKLTPLVDNVVKAWAHDLINQHIEHIIRFAGTSETEFNVYIGQIIEHAIKLDMSLKYKADVTDCILLFIKRLPNVSQDVIAYTALFEIITRVGAGIYVYIMVLRGIDDSLSKSWASAENKSQLRLLRAQVENGRVVRLNKFLKNDDVCVVM